MKERKEEIKVADTRIKCKVSEITSTDAHGHKSYRRTWVSDDVPGGLVRSEIGMIITTAIAMTIK